MLSSLCNKQIPQYMHENIQGERTCDFAFVSLCYGRSGEEMCTEYAMAASGRMQYDYKQTNENIHWT
jgi:hypothetical protein